MRIYSHGWYWQEIHFNTQYCQRHDVYACLTDQSDFHLIGVSPFILGMNWLRAAVCNFCCTPAVHKDARPKAKLQFSVIQFKSYY